MESKRKNLLDIPIAELCARVGKKPFIIEDDKFKMIITEDSVYFRKK
jgi:hypothetical protein